MVESKTKNKIQQLIRKGDIDDQTRLVLINAIYLNASWKTEFPTKNTRTAPFYNKDQTYNCEFMHTKGEYKLYEDDKVQVIDIPYASDLSSMIILLPKEGESIADFLNDMNAEKLADISAGMEVKELN